MKPLPEVRSDALPENYEYTDDGCTKAPSCLSCPFELCRYDDPLQDLEPRRQMVSRWRTEDHMSLAAIAERLKCSIRTVCRDLAAAGLTQTRLQQGQMAQRPADAAVSAVVASQDESA